MSLTRDQLGSRLAAVGIAPGAALQIAEYLRDATDQSPIDVGTSEVTTTGSTIDRTMADRGKDVACILDFIPTTYHAGIKARTSTVDLSEYIQAAVDGTGTYGARIYAPTGYYPYSDDISINKSFTSFHGDGARNTEFVRLNATTGTFIVEDATDPGVTQITGFTMRDVSFRNAYLPSNLVITAEPFLRLNKVESAHLNDMTIHNGFGGVEILGGRRIFLTNVTPCSSPSSWTGVQSGSYFIKVNRSSDGQVPIEVHITNNEAHRIYTTDYVENGIIIHCVDGIWLTATHVQGVDLADLLIYPVDGDEQLTGIHLIGGWLDNDSDYGIRVLGNTTAAFGAIQLTDVQFLTQRVAAMHVGSTSTSFDGFRAIGGKIVKSAKGAQLAAGKVHTFVGTGFLGCSEHGAYISDGADNVHFTACQFLEDVQGNAAATGMVGIEITNAASSNITAHDCDFDLTAADITDASTSDANEFWNNRTTKGNTADTVTSSVLQLSETGREFYVSDGLSFNNMSGRQNGRRVVLHALGTVTITHVTNQMEMKNGANVTLVNGDSIEFIYKSDITGWRETWRSTQFQEDAGSALAATISGGTLAVAKSFMVVDTEGAAASDDLDNISINGSTTAVTGRRIRIVAASSSRDVVLKHATGNIRLNGAADKTLTSVLDIIELVGQGGVWVQSTFSDNAT